ncbi:MAG: NAD-dependent epimerase/dehydratase family protein, partial [Chloroflexota bacterium]|nr:NAD-dependent epimerase/dehydratase family protein [Chloroflexota bacterium]
MKVLLVGGSGHVGTFITPYLRQKHELRVLDVAPPKHQGIEYVEGSVTDPGAVRRALAGVEAFVYLVMKTPTGGAKQSVEEIVNNYQVNTL